MMSSDNGVKNFSVIREEELLEICRLRGIVLSANPLERAQQINELKQSLIGLAFSGGGIRSATFGLGVLQALKEKGLLQSVDYLSTVSGGGYIGSWLTANCKRANQRKEAPWLSPAADWSQAIRHLRRYSNYLSPDLSLLSADTWSMVIIWLRNTLLLQSMIVMAIACLLLVPRLALPVIDWGGHVILRWGMAVLFVYLIVWLSANLEKIKITEDSDSQDQHTGLLGFVNKFSSTQGLVQLHVVILMLISLGFSALLWQSAEAGRGFFASVLFITSSWKSFWWFLLLPYLAMVLLSACSSRAHIISWLVAVPATLVLYVLLAFTLYWIGDWHSDAWKGNGGHLLAFAWAPPMVLGAFSLAINVLIGMQGNGSYEYVREWWSRFGAWLAICGAAWMLVLVVAFYGPLWAEWLYYEGSWKSLSSGWLGTTLAGLLAGKSDTTDGVEAGGNLNKFKDILAKATPFVFIVGLLIAVATSVHLLIASADDGFEANRVSLIGSAEPDEALRLRVSAKSDLPVDASAEQPAKVDSEADSAIPEHSAHWTLLAEAQQKHFQFIVWTFGVCLFCVSLLSWRIDINEFSLNAFYRNRLARCYLGASRKPGERQPHEFTGFDRNDDLPLAGLTVPQSPFHIVNCALNLGGSNDLSLHTRHSAVFTLTPLSCGSHYQIKKQSGEVISEIGYFDTATYGGRSPTLGQAVSVSGAAASPNMGYHTSAPVAFLMTLFNARLGWWFPNPRKSECNLPSPRDSLGYLLKELFGGADEKQAYLAISDGGHFENLAAYELIKRQCRVVIISDGECDPQLQFEGLANLIRIAEVDRLAKIEIDVRSIQPQDGSGWSHRCCAIGRIHYKAFSKTAQDGWLIYIKAAMNGLEDTAILQYKAQHSDFPHETTGDQFYAEDQFESYRNLGLAITEKLFGKLEVGTAIFADEPMRELFNIFSAELPTKAEFTRHADALMQIWGQLREDGGLDALDDELFAPDQNGKPERAIFYKCSEMIQLMENVYLDLDFEETWQHPDNHGWKELFENWAKSPLMIQTWKLTSTTYGLRFQSFWNRHLA